MVTRLTKSLLVMVACSSFVLPMLLRSASLRAEGDNTFHITLTEYAYHVEGLDDTTPLQLETGKEYTLEFSNEGIQEHEFLIGGPAIEIEPNIHHDFETNLLANVETVITRQGEHSPFTIGTSGLIEFELLPHESLVVTFTLPDEAVGNWEMGCFVSLDANATEEHPGMGHYDVGMHHVVTVIKGA